MSGWDRAEITRLKAELTEARAEIERLQMRVELEKALRGDAFPRPKWAKDESDPTRATLRIVENEREGAALGPQPVHPAGDGEHVHVCATCGQTHNGRGWVTP